MAHIFKHSYKEAAKDIISLAVYNVGYQKCSPLYKWGNGVRDHYLIHHIIEGKGYYTVGNKTYTINKGDTFIIYPYTEVTYWADRENPWEYYWVGFDGSDAEILLKNTEFSKSNPIMSFDFGNNLKKALYNIYKSKGNSYDKSALMTGYLYIALSIIIEKSDKKERIDYSSVYAKRATDFISHNYGTEINVTDVADSIGISRSQLFRIFKHNFNISPSEYILNYRIMQACNLLRNTDLSIIAIANSVGFNDNLYFSKAFSKAKKISPTQYRKAKSPTDKWYTTLIMSVLI